MAKVLLGACSTREKFFVAGRFIMGKLYDSKYEGEARAYMMGVFNGMGLIGLYRIILDNQQDLICQNLKIMSNPDNLPLLVHCSHGKDRTGVMCALVLRFCGATPEAIAADYHLSEPHGMSEEGRARMETIAELDTDTWCAAPVATMLEFLAYLDAKHGGVHS